MDERLQHKTLAINTLNLIEEKVGNSLEYISAGMKINNKWDIGKPKSFCKVKDTISGTNQHLIEREKIFTNSITDRRLISKSYKELKKLDMNKLYNQI